MTDDKYDNTETASKGLLNQDDIALWREMTSDVERFEGREYVEASAITVPIDDIPRPNLKVRPVIEKPVMRASSPQGRDLDRNTERRLKRGELAIEGKLDLHGLNQGQARGQLLQFIKASHAAGKRCVLVVTGKGNSGRKSDDWLAREPGVLKRKVPDWLHEAELNAIVLRAVTAQPQHGGDGALYVYLRRQR